MRKFKTESKKMLDIMVNSIYTHKEVFMRELLSNASDAIDKLYYKSLTEGTQGLGREDFFIEIRLDKEKRAITVEDNGIGMTEEELDRCLGIIANSGTEKFRESAEKNDEISIIGQFGVGFYSAFMVAKRVEVVSKAFGSDEAHVWSSDGSDGYDVKKTEKDSNGTAVTLWLRDDADEENYSEFLEEYRIRELVKKYSDYIRYPIKCEMTKYREKKGKQESYKEMETLNSMVPIWKKQKSETKKEEYEAFYKEKFYDYENPARVIRVSAEGRVDYEALLYIPSRPQYDYYTKNFEKGLKLYMDGVLVNDCVKELLPDHFSFVKGLVDSQLTLNVSRETIQHNAQLQFIAKNLEKQIKKELLEFLEEDREGYLKFYKGFARQLKYGTYDNWGRDRETLQDLLMFHSIKEDRLITFAEYEKNKLESQKCIYYAAGNSIASIKALPLSEKILDDGYDIICLTDEIDEFVMKVLSKYRDLEFKSISEYEEAAVDGVEQNEELTKFMKDALGERVTEVRLTTRLKSHPVALSTKGALSMEMERILKKNPQAEELPEAKAEKVLEINADHELCGKLVKLLSEDKDKLKKVAEILYDQALIIEGMPVENPTRLAALVCELV